jgi:hypothetical protein
MNDNSEVYSKALSIATSAVLNLMKTISPQLGNSTALIAVDSVAKSIVNKPFKPQEVPTFYTPDVSDLTRKNGISSQIAVKQETAQKKLDWIAISLSTAAFSYMIYTIIKHTRQ